MKIAVIAGVICSLFAASSAFADSCITTPDGGAKACYISGYNTIEVYDLKRDGASARAFVWARGMESTLTTECVDSYGAGTIVDCEVSIPGYASYVMFYVMTVNYTTGRVLSTSGYSYSEP